MGTEAGNNPMAMMQILSIVIGVYMLYAGIVGKGAAYKNNYPEKLQEPIRKILRKFYLVGGVIMTAGAVLEYVGGFGEEITNYIVWGYTGLCLLLFVGYWILIRVKYGDQLK